MNPLDKIITDLLQEKNEDRLINILCDDEKIDVDGLVGLIEERLESYKAELEENEINEFNKYILSLKSSSKVRAYFLAKLRDRLAEEFPEEKMAMIDGAIFWELYAISIKKCLNSPKANLDRTKYNSCLEALFKGPFTEKQEEAHNICVKSFNYDLGEFRDYQALLKLFVPVMRSFKKERTKKKYISRVLHKTKKIIQVHRLTYRNNTDLVFGGKNYVVPEQFARVIVKTFLSEE